MGKVDRKNISKRTRFEVFKRDNFTCFYCGRHVPDVILELDHIMPISRGGTNEIDNLVTSCADCNRGKGGVPLSELASKGKYLGAKAELLQEQLEQMKAYNEALEEIKAYEDSCISKFINKWWTYRKEPPYPHINFMYKQIRILPMADILSAIDIAALKTRCEETMVHYYCGILRQKRLNLERERRAEDDAPEVHSSGILDRSVDK